MSYIYLVTRKDGFPIVAFTRKYQCSNFLSYKGLTDADVDLYTMSEGGTAGKSGEPKKVDKDYLDRKVNK